MYWVFLCLSPYLGSVSSSTFKTVSGKSKRFPILFKIREKYLMERDISTVDTAYKTHRYKVQ